MERGYSVDNQPDSLFPSGNGRTVEHSVSIFKQDARPRCTIRYLDLLQPCHVRVKLRLDFCRAGCRSQGAALGRAFLRKLTFLAARRRSPPPHPLVIAQTGPRTGIASSPHLSCRAASLHPLSLTQPPPPCKADIACTHAYTQGRTPQGSRYRTGRRNHGSRRKSPRYC